MSIEFDLSGTNLAAAMEKVASNMDDTRPLMASIARTMLAQVQLSFRSGVDPYGVPWAPVARPGQPLMDNRTLFRSIGQRHTQNEAIVGTNIEYAPIHQFGFHGTVTVSEHAKVISQAFGKPITPKTITVKSHKKQQNVTARSFFPTPQRGLPYLWQTQILRAVQRHMQP